MADALVRELAVALTPETKPKPRGWSYYTTETGGAYRVLLEKPDKSLAVLAEVAVTVPKGRQATVSVRTSVGLADIRKPEPEGKELADA